MNIGNLIATIGVDVRGLDRQLGDAQRRFKQFGKSTKALGRSMSVGITAPLTAIGATSFNVFADFEQSMAKVLAVSGATGAEFKALEADAKRLGGSTRFTASEVSALQLEYAKLGFSASEITKVTESTLQLAQATGSDLAQSAEVAGATLRGFGMEADETQRVTDVMAASFSSTALDMDSFAESMKYVAPVAASAGLSIEETTAMLGALANSGIKGSQAGTALRRIISELGATGGNVSEKFKELSRQGLNLADAKDEVGRSAQSALLILSNTTDEQRELTEALNGSAGAAAQMANIMDSTASGSMAKMRSAIEAAQISLGQALAPVVTKIAEIIGSLATKFSSLSSSTKQYIVVIGGIAAVIGPLLTMLPTFGAAIGTLFTAMTGPIGLIILALAGLVTAFVYFWEDIKGPLVKAINLLIEFENEFRFIGRALTGIKIIFKSVWSIIENGIDNVINGFTTFGKVIEAIVKGDFNKVGEILEESLFKFAEDGIELGKDLYQNFLDGLEEEKGRQPLELVSEQDLDNLVAKFKNLVPNLMGGLGGGGSTEGVQTGGGMQRIAARGADSPARTLQGVPEIAKRATVEVRKLNNEFSMTVDLGNMISSSLISVTESLGGLASGTISFNEFMVQSIQMLGGLLQQLGAAFISAAFASEVFQKSLIANPPMAIAAGIALVAAGALINGLAETIAAPKMADGGLVFGRSLVEVGEYSGARSNPEVIAPLDKLQGYISGAAGGGGTLTTTLKGSDIVIAMERTQKDLSRRR